jgi:hypothetical protein
MTQADILNKEARFAGEPGQVLGGTSNRTPQPVTRKELSWALHRERKNETENTNAVVSLQQAGQKADIETVSLMPILFIRPEATRYDASSSGEGNETTRLHQSCCRLSSRLAACGVRTTGSDAGDWITRPAIT